MLSRYQVFFVRFGRQLEALLYVSLLLLSGYTITFPFYILFSKMGTKEGHGSPGNVSQAALQRPVSTYMGTIPLSCTK